MSKITMEPTMTLTVCDLLARTWQISLPRYRQPVNSVQEAIEEAAGELAVRNSPLPAAALEFCTAQIRASFGVDRTPIAGVLEWYDDPQARTGYSSHDASFILARACELAAQAIEPGQDRFQHLGDLPSPWSGK